MKLLKLYAKHYRSLRDVSLEFSDLNLFIGANASGKSTVLDALRLLHEGVQTRDFRTPVFSRGSVIHLAWKGKEAERIDVSKQAPTACALTAAAADASFPAREVAEFVSRWGFFDPNPFLLRHDWTGLDSGSFDPYGRNLAETLHALQNSSPEIVERICSATQSIVGLPSGIETRETEGRFHFVQTEPGLQFSVHQMGVSSGTLRMLALMTALLGQPEATLIGIEEPENYVHPTALSSFVEHLLSARGRVQFLVTTHSPLLLDFLNDPAAVRVVQHNEHGGTTVVQEKDPEGVRGALDASGFGLGQYYETKGFGAS